MPIAEAHVETERPGRYLVQLCRHFSHQGRHLLRPQGAHVPGDAPPHPDMRAQVEGSRTRGTVTFGWGQCTMQAHPGALALRAEAADEEHLQRIQDLVTGHLDRFARRDHLTVVWQRHQPPTAQPGDARQAEHRRPPQEP